MVLIHLIFFLLKMKKMEFIEKFGEEAWEVEKKERAKEASRRWKREHREQNLERDRQYKLSHKEKISEYDKNYRMEHKDEIREKRRRYYLENADSIKEYRRIYNIENRDTILARKKVYRSKNKGPIAEYARLWRKNNPGYLKEYYANNPEALERSRKSRKEFYKKKYYTKDYRARYLVNAYSFADKKEGRGECTLTSEWIKENIFNSKCTYCGDSDWRHLGCDRIDNGLPHTPENCICSCGICNIEKNDKYSVEEFVEYRSKHPRHLGTIPKVEKINGVIKKRAI